MSGRDEEAHAYASPACSMHELDPAYFGLAAVAPIPPGPELRRWRKAERERLLAARTAAPAADRAERTRRMIARLDTLAGAAPGVTIGVYWPFRGEPDLRPWMRAHRANGVRIALPVVVAPKTPLVFRLWAEGAKLAHGVWNIPVPAEGEAVQPSVVIAPMVGFDARCYRLGYGGGFYDRTLAALPADTLAIGLAFGFARLPTVHPQPHDVPMRYVVTEDEILVRPG